MTNRNISRFGPKRNHTVHSGWMYFWMVFGGYWFIAAMSPYIPLKYTFPVMTVFLVAMGIGFLRDYIKDK